MQSVHFYKSERCACRASTCFVDECACRASTCFVDEWTLCTHSVHYVKNERFAHTTFTLTRNVVDGVCAQRPLLQSGRCPRTASTLTHRKVGGVCAQRSLLQSGRCARRASTLTRHIVDAAHAQRSLLQKWTLCTQNVHSHTVGKWTPRTHSVHVLQSDQCARTASTCDAKK